MNKHYDVGAFIWPAYQDDPRARIFWPQGMGEWQSVMSNTPKFAGHDQPRRPLWGYQNEADPYVMEMQIAAAADHGVNVFIYDWYWYDRRPFLENCLNNGFLKAQNNHRMKFCLMWANHDAVTVWDKRLSDQGEQLVWHGSVDRHEFERACLRVIRQYFDHPSYYRIDGKPVFQLYDLDTLIRGLGGPDAAADALDWFRNAAVKAGHAGLHLQAILRRHMEFNVTGITGDNVGTQQEIIEKLGFDGLTHYQFCHFTSIDDDYEAIVERVVDEWQRVAADFSIPYFPHVSVGWDNNPRFQRFRPGIVKNNTPKNFAKALQHAKRFVDMNPNQTPFVTLNSWNEWTETSYLQPDDKYGYGYLEAVKRVFG